MAKSPLSLLEKALDDEHNFVSIFTARSNRRFGNELQNGENDVGHAGDPPLHSFRLRPTTT
jgi:hypothetical protein